MAKGIVDVLDKMVEVMGILQKSIEGHRRYNWTGREVCFAILAGAIVGAGSLALFLKLDGVL